MMAYTVAEQVVTLQHHYQQNDYEAFFNLIEQVLFQLKENDDTASYISCMLDKASLYFDLQNYTLSLQTLSNVSQMVDAEATVSHKMRYYNLLAAIHGATQRYVETFKYLQLAQFLAEQVNDKNMLMRIYHNLSFYYFENQQYEQCLLYCHKAIAYYEDEQEEPDNEDLLTLTYARVLIKLDRLDEAKHIIESRLSRLTPMSPRIHVTITLTKTEYYVQQQLLEKAYDVLKEASASFDAHTPDVVLVYEQLCKISKKCQPMTVYLADLKAFFALKNDVQQQQKAQQLQSLQMYFDDRPYKELCWHDPLTNMYNRRYLEESYQPAARLQAMVIFDIDHFKLINDQYGHLAGDQAIQAVAERAQQFFNEEQEILVRLGGDEFAARLYAPSIIALEERLQSFIDNIRELTITYQAHQFRLTVSLGAYYTANTRTLEEMLKHADLALYEAKRHGRNQFMLHVGGADNH